MRRGNALSTFLLAALVLAATIPAGISAQTLDPMGYRPALFGPVPMQLEIQRGSSVSFYARATLHWFTGTTRQIQGTFVVDKDGPLEEKTNTFSIPAASLKTGARTRDAVMRKTLRTDIYPNIEFTLNEFELVKRSDELAEYHVRVTGDLTIRNVTREITFQTFMKVYGQRALINGQTDLNLSDFEIEKPVLFGFISVKDRLTVKWSLDTNLTFLEPPEAPDTEPADEPQPFDPEDWELRDGGAGSAPPDAD